MLLMLKVATFSGSLSVLSAASYPPLYKTQGRGIHYVGDVGAIKSPGHPPGLPQQETRITLWRIGTRRRQTSIQPHSLFHTSFWPQCFSFLFDTTPPDA